MLIKPQFYGIIARASNVGSVVGDYTTDMFREDFPQFYHTVQGVTSCWVPQAILGQFVEMANHTILKDKWLDGWRYAAGLYVAHNATLYLRAYKPESESPQAAAGSGDVVGNVQSATLGDASVTYDTQGSAADWGDLNLTQYGQMLAAKARLVGMGGSYVI